MPRSRAPSGFIRPCIPVVAEAPPSGPGWIHEVKHDGYRMMVRRIGDEVRIWSRSALEWTGRLPRIVAAVRRLRVESVVLDGEAVCEDETGRPDFHGLRSDAGCRAAILYAFDLLELNGADLRGEPVETRKSSLARLLRRPPDGLVYVEHLEHEGIAVFREACRLGLEGIVSKRLGSRYRSGRSDDWRKVICPEYRRR